MNENLAMPAEFYESPVGQLLAALARVWGVGGRGGG